MRNGLSLDLSKVQPYASLSELDKMEGMVNYAHTTVHEKTGAGNDFLGWLDLPVNYDKEEFERIKVAAEKIKENSDVLIVIGIGGSYLGARAAIEALTNNFYNMLPNNKRKTPKVFFVGNNISSTYITDLFEAIEGLDVSVNVISKSGTTTEPAIAFRMFKDFMEKKYGVEGAKERIFATTDKERGALKGLADTMGYETFVVPDDIGGRFSVISAVGLLPLCVAGIDIDKFVAGFKKGIENYTVDSFEENKAIQYAAIRNMLNEDGKDLEVLVNYEPKLKYVSEWWKQLFAESEGKDGKGIFPVSVNNTTDLHSVGQMIQEGKRNLFETVLKVQNANKDLTIMEDEENLDGLNYLAGKKMSFVNEKAMEGTIIAHVKGNVPNILLTIDDVSAESLGELFYFFEIVVGVSGYMLGVNPFNQPGVEEYKSQMFKLLGKPGY